jgi:hypothetical protein
MKTFMYWSNRYLLPFCFLLVMALTSCDKDEVIDLKEDDLYGDDIGLTDEPPKFSPETATQVIVDANGEITGYLDYDFNYRDSEGHLVTTSTTAANWVNPEARPMIFLYNKPFFDAGQWSGDMRAFFTNASGGIKVSGSNFQDYKKPKSILVPPGCKAKLYWRRSDNSFYVEEVGKLSSKSPAYLRYINTSNITLARIDVDWNSNINKKNMLCGYAAKSDGLKYGNLPIFYNTAISQQQLNSITWENNIRSYRSNKNGRCKLKGDGVVFSINKFDKTGINNTISYSKFNKSANLGFSGTSSIIPDGNYKNRESDVGMTVQEANSFQQGFNDGRAGKKYPYSVPKFCGTMKTKCQTFRDRLEFVDNNLGAGLCWLIGGGKNLASWKSLIDKSPYDWYLEAKNLGKIVVGDSAEDALAEAGFYACMVELYNNLNNRTGTCAAKYNKCLDTGVWPFVVSN